jgi:hypothetical protein
VPARSGDIIEASYDEIEYTGAVQSRGSIINPGDPKIPK